MQRDLPKAASHVPSTVSTRHAGRDRLFTIVFIVTLIIIGVLAFRPRTNTTLEIENRTMAPWPVNAVGTHECASVKPQTVNETQRSSARQLSSNMR